MATRPVPKKVRLACQRCRLRRVKCDGQIPACSNCSKAGEPCLDVDGKNGHQLIPRNFHVNEARARIQWLEDIIKTRLPDVDLSAGPQVEITAPEPQPSAALTSPSSLKRRQSEGSSLEPEQDEDEPVAEKVYSVAYNLGMVSLNSDSSQKHYLGSSSGVLFTNLIRASPSSIQTPSTASPISPDPFRWDEPHESTSSQQVLRQRYLSLHSLLGKELPTKEAASTLVQTYLRWVHPEFPVLDPDSILGALDAIYSCAAMSASSSTSFHADGWPEALAGFRWNARQVQPGAIDDARPPPMAVVAFITFMIFNVAAIVKVRRRTYGFAPDQYYRAARLFAPECFSQTSLSSLQALTMLIIHCLHTPAEANIWTLTNIGIAHCVELGIHRDHSQESQAEQQLKRFVFYTIYSLDRSIASIQGRPPGLRDEAFDVKILDTMVSTWESRSSSFAVAVTHYSRHNFEMQQIISDIKTQLYHLPNKSVRFPPAAPMEPLAIQRQIHEALKSWWSAAMDDNFELHGVDAHQARVWKIRLRLRYYKAIILLFQPSQTIRHPSESSLQIVFDCASSILEDYQVIHDLHALDFGWRTVQSVFSAGATLVYSFWTSKGIQRTADATSISRRLRTCISLLAIGGEWWPSARSSQASFGSIVDLTIQKIYSRPPRAKQPRLTTRQTSRDTPEVDVGSQVASGDAWRLATDQNFDYGTTSMDDWAGSAHPDTLSPGLQMAGPQWSLGLGDPGGFGSEAFPEIEQFLADFGRADFHWNVPTDDVEGQFGGVQGLG